MGNDFEKKLTDALHDFGKWNPPPLTSEMRRRLVELPQIPAFTLIWHTANCAGQALLEFGDLIQTALIPSALLQGSTESTAQTLECRLGAATLRLSIAIDQRSNSELHMAVSLEGNNGGGNFDIELFDTETDDLIESRPLRNNTSLGLREGGLYYLVVMKGSEAIGRVRFKLDKIEDGV